MKQLIVALGLCLTIFMMGCENDSDNTTAQAKSVEESSEAKDKVEPKKPKKVIVSEEHIQKWILDNEQSYYFKYPSVDVQEHLVELTLIGENYGIFCCQNPRITEEEVQPLAEYIQRQYRKYMGRTPMVKVTTHYGQEFYTAKP